MADGWFTLKIPSSLCQQVTTILDPQNQPPPPAPVSDEGPPALPVTWPQ